jgi:hypothetical protein
MAQPFDPSVLDAPAAPPPPAALTLSPGGVLGEAASAGGYAGAAEQEWLRDRDYAQEATFANVGGGLLLGDSYVGDRKVERLGKNLLTEAEHAAHARAARDLLGKQARATGNDADELARRGPDDEGVTYLRENAPKLITELSSKQAKAAQSLLDSYTKLAPLRPDASELQKLIPNRTVEQARWTTQTRDQVSDLLGDVPPEAAAPLRERLAKLADGDDPTRWFGAASELSDGLLRARTKAGRSGADPVTLERLDEAKRTLDEGLHSDGLWGQAGAAEGQRAAGYARRYGDHIDAFEEAFTAEVGGKRKVDPGRFRAMLESSDPSMGDVLARTVDSARVTADVAEKFGRKEDAARIRAAVATLEKTGRQGAAIQRAGGSVPRETDDPAVAALEWLSAAGPSTGGTLSTGYLTNQLHRATVDGEPNAAAQAASQRLAARDGAFRATASLAKLAAEDSRAGVASLLEPPADDPSDGLDVQPPRGAGLNADNFAAHRSHVDKMARDPAYFGSVMAASFGSLPDAAPEVFSALSQQAAKTVQYLASVAPGGKDGGPFGLAHPVSEDELWEYNERLQSVADPTYVRSELASGRLSTPAVETFELLYPTRYERLRRDVFERLQELNEQGIPVPVQAREQIDTALNIDGGGEPGLTWKVAERAYAAVARKNAAGKVNGVADGDRGQATSSDALATLKNGASAIAQTG